MWELCAFSKGNSSFCGVACDDFTAELLSIQHNSENISFEDMCKANRTLM